MPPAKFDPAVPLVQQIEYLDNAIIVPWGAGEKVRMARPSGVFREDGSYCETAMCYRSSGQPLTREPEPIDPATVTQEIDGPILFGGVFYGHFGHALCETISRLWAVDHIGMDVAQAYYFHRTKKGWPMRPFKDEQPIFKALAPIPAPFASNEPIRVRKLIVPPQGFGTRDMIGGCPEFRDFVRTRFRAHSAEVETPRKIYISRTQLFRKRGRILLEEYIEQKMVENGYEIFHPQGHDLPTQIAYYKGADRIVSTDSSPLHLAAFVADPSCRVGMIVRRPGPIYRDYINQYRSFLDQDIAVSNAVMRGWVRDGEAQHTMEMITQVDLENAGQVLADAGLIDHNDWTNPSETDLQTALADMQERLGETLIEVPL